MMDWELYASAYAGGDTNTKDVFGVMVSPTLYEYKVIYKARSGTSSDGGAGFSVHWVTLWDGLAYGYGNPYFKESSVSTNTTDHPQIEMVLSIPASINMLRLTASRGSASYSAANKGYAEASLYRRLKNSLPILALQSSADNYVLYEGSSTLAISGDANDADTSDTLNVKYQINSEAIQTIVSSATKPLNFSKVLSFSGLKLNDGSTAVTGTLAQGVTHTFKVWAEDSKGGKSAITTRSFTVVHNQVPTISGQDTNLGNKNLPFSVTYSISDVNEADSLTVIEKLNGSALKTINNAPRATEFTISITAEILAPLALNSSNTIQIEVNDGKGGVSYRNYYFTKSNAVPTVTGADEDLGAIQDIPSKTYQVSDIENDTITVTEKINGVVIKTFQATPNTNYTITIPKEEWLKLNLTDTHSLAVELKDSQGGVNTRVYTFKRSDDKIQLELKVPFETDIQATKLLVSPTWVIPTGAVALVEACNNAFDAAPTWENITNQVLINRHYNFTNTTKTAAKWGINIRFTISRGTAVKPVILDGFGGAFE